MMIKQLSELEDRGRQCKRQCLPILNQNMEFIFSIDTNVCRPK